MSDANLAKEIGRIEATIEAQGKAIDELNADVKTLLRVINEARGGWRTLIIVAGVAGVVGGLVSKMWPVLGKGGLWG